MTRMHDARLAGAAMLGLLVATPVRADVCCYAVCGVSREPPLVLLVTCEPTRCPETSGRCTVWAEQTSVACGDRTTCEAGPRESDAAEAAIERLAKDRSLVVRQSMTFKLRSGELIRFDPR